MWSGSGVCGLTQKIFKKVPSVRINKFFLVGLLIAGLFSACAPQVNTVLDVTAAPQEPAEAESVPGEAIPVRKCQYGACVRDVIMVNDGTNLLVFIDLTDQNGDVVLGEEKFIMGNLLVAGYLLLDDGAQETVFEAELGPQQYHCYSGEDLPWNEGVMTATCGFSVPIPELKVMSPRWMTASGLSCQPLIPFHRKL